MIKKIFVLCDILWDFIRCCQTHEKLPPMLHTLCHLAFWWLNFDAIIHAQQKQGLGIFLIRPWWGQFVFKTKDTISINNFDLIVSKLNQKCFPYLGNLNIILQRLVSLTNNFLQSHGLEKLGHWLGKKTILAYIFENWDFTPLLHIFVFSKDFFVESKFYSYAGFFIISLFSSEPP